MTDTPLAPLPDWIASVCADLGVDPGTVPVREILDLTRDVAHNVNRPAAPVTAFIVGMAVANSAADTAAAIAACERIGELARDRGADR